MEHKFEWNKETRELVELRTGDELVDSQQQRVEGRFENKTIYPEKTARDMIKELQRQINGSDIEIKATEKAIKNMEKDLKPVGKEFFIKFKACMARMGIEKQKEVLENKTEQKEAVQEQIEKLKEVMGNDF